VIAVLGAFVAVGLALSAVLQLLNGPANTSTLAASRARPAAVRGFDDLAVMGEPVEQTRC
jgi:hypothetical protein